MTELSSTQRGAIGALALVAVTGITHASLLGFDFVYDDRTTVVSNGFVAQLTNLAHIVDGTAFSSGVVDAERPVMVASVMADRALFGLNPVGHHAHSVFWHCLNVLLLAWVVLRVTGDRMLSWVSALIFAILPAHVEAVAVVSYREDLLATAAVLGATAVLLRGGPGLLAASLVCLGTLAKESAVLVLLLWPLVSWIAERPARERWRGAAWLGAGMVLALSIRLAWAGFSWAPAAAIDIPDRGGFWASASAATRVLLMQLGQLLVPIGFGAVHPDPPPVWPGHVEWLGLALLGTTLVAAIRRRADRVLVGGASLVFVGLCPLLVWWRLPNLWADRFLYLPSVGFSLLAARLLLGFATTRTRLVIAGLFLAVVAGLHFTTQQGFRDDRTIWTRAVHAAPLAPRSWQGLAGVRLREGRLTDARRAAERGLSLDSNHSGLLALTGVLACMEGDRRATWAAFGRARAHTHHRARLSLQEAACALQLRQFDLAIELAERAAHEAPWRAEAHTIRGQAHQAKGELSAAETALRAGVTADPDRPDLWAALARFYAEIGSIEKALEARKRVTK